MENIEVYRTSEKPDLMIFAQHILPKIREFYQDPENIKKLQEWKERHHEQHEH